MHWRAANSSKAYGETFTLYYSILWIGFLAVVVILRWYESFSPNDYILVGLGIALPCFIAPLLVASRQERNTPLSERYIVKANLFILIVGYLGNHFYTHYFYRVLGMRYTGPLGPGMGLEINQVPVSMFLCTHPYFMTYHILATPILRAVRSLLRGNSLCHPLFGMFVLLLAFVTAFMETWTISGFPYYTYPDLVSMLTTGSAFYGIFFIVTYPVFFRLDEDPNCLWSLGRVVTEALAAMMLVLLSADLLRIAFTSGTVNPLTG